MKEKTEGGYYEKFLNDDRKIVRSSFALLNVKYLIVSDSDGKNTLINLGTGGPVFVSPTIVPLPTEVETDSLTLRIGEFVKSKEIDVDIRALTELYRTQFLVLSMGIDPQTLVCEQIYVVGADGRWLGTNPEVEVLEHTVRMQRVDLKLRVTEACFARLAYSYFPHLRVTVDGREVVPLRTAGGFMAVQLEAGEHDLTLEAELSPLRRGLLAINLACLAATAYLFIGNRRRKR